MNAPPLMKREKVEHILRAAGVATGLNQFVVVGTAAIVAWREVVPPELAMSRDVDLFAYDVPNAEQVSDLLDGVLGQASNFDANFGYYCDGVGSESALMPDDWMTRSIRFSTPSTNGVVAIVPEPNDIAISKLHAWRPKDVDWLRAAVAAGILDIDVMRSRLSAVSDPRADKVALAGRLDVLDRPPIP